MVRIKVIMSCGNYQFLAQTQHIKMTMMMMAMMEMEEKEKKITVTNKEKEKEENRKRKRRRKFEFAFNKSTVLLAHCLLMCHLALDKDR